MAQNRQVTSTIDPKMSPFSPARPSSHVTTILLLFGWHRVSSALARLCTWILCATGAHPTDTHIKRLRKQNNDPGRVDF